MLTAMELVERSGASYRQVDLWTRRGWLVAEFRSRENFRPSERPTLGGSGTNRVYAEQELAVACVMLLVSRLGAGVRLNLVAEALRTLPMGEWPGSRLVVGLDHASIDGPIGMAALVVDLGACVVGDAGLAAVV